MPPTPDDSEIFHALLHGSTDHIYIFDRDLRYTHASRGAAERLGRKPEEMVGKTWHELGLPPETMLSVEAQLRRVFETGETVRHDLLFAGRSFEYVMFPVHDRVAVVSRDVTARVQAEEEVRRSSERYRAFVANSSEGIWRFELDEPMDPRIPVEEQVDHAFKHGYLGECNDVMARMYGFERAEEIIGARLPDMLDPKQEQNREFLRAFVASGYRLNNAESAETDRHGNRKYFLNSFIGIVENGLMMRAWGTQRDITEQKALQRRHEEDLATERARSEFINDANDLFVRSLDYEQTLRNLASLAVPRLADWCAVDMLDADGKSRRIAVEHRDPEMVRFAYDLEERYPSEAITRVTKSGQTEWMAEIPHELLVESAKSPEHLELLRKMRFRSFILAPIRVGEGIAGALTLVNDVGSRAFTDADVHVAEELALRAGHAIENARLYQQAVDANRAKDEFLATLSHELRTPLTAILGWANLLRLSGYDMETTRKAVETIEQSARTQAAIIDDLLDVSRIVTGKFSLNVVTVDAVPIVNAVVASTRPAAEAKGLTIAVDAPSSVMMRADSNRLQQIIWNLMSNAVKFSGNGRVIKIHLRREDDDAVLQVRDAGIGIAPELLPRVFDRFWQADSSTHRTQGGLGLGLAIVKHLVELHGGTASAASDGAGLGATFTVRLPIGVVVRAADAQETQPAARGRRLLLVDDDAATRDVVGRTLEHFGARVTTAASADEAIMLMDGTGFDHVLTDLAMPGHDGYWLLREIRRTRPKMPVTAITALSHSDEDMKNAGFDSWLRKPVRTEALKEFV